MAKYYLGTTKFVELIMRHNDIPAGSFSDHQLQVMKEEGVQVQAAMIAESIPVLFNVFHHFPKFYDGSNSLSRRAVVDGIKSFLMDSKVAVYYNGAEDKEIVLTALDLYADTGNTFGDCLAKCLADRHGIPVLIPGYEEYPVPSNSEATAEDDEYYDTEMDVVSPDVREDASVVINAGGAIRDEVPMTEAVLLSIEEQIQRVSIAG